MTGNGRGNMRPASKSPPFLVVGLVIAMCILVFNYWNISSKNKDLTSQLESLQVDFRSVSDKHLAVEKRASDLSSQAAEFQSMVSKLQNSATEKDNKVSSLTGEVNSLKSEMEQVQSQAQLQIQHAQDEKKSVLEEVEEVRGKLENELKKEVVCHLSACREVVRELMKVMLDTVGKSKVISAFSLTHANILSMVDDLLRVATDPPVQQPLQGNPQPYAQGVAQQQQLAGQDGPVQSPDSHQNTYMALNHQNSIAAQNHNVGQALDTAGNPHSDQSLHMGQNPDMDQNHNVVQMQQQQPGSFGQMMAAQDGRENPQEQHLRILDQPVQNAEANNPQHAAPQSQEGGMAPREEEKGGNQEIVAQNIPQRAGEETAISIEDNHQLQDLNAAPAQEDMKEDNHMDLPEDEMDKQAKANQGAGDMGNLDDNDFHDQLQELGRNPEEEHQGNNIDRADMEEADRHDMQSDVEKMDVENQHGRLEDDQIDKRDFDDGAQQIDGRDFDDDAQEDGH